LQEIKKHFYQAILISIFAVVAGFSFKIFLANIIDKDTLTLYYTAIDIFSFSLLILIGFRSSMVVAYAKSKKDENIINIFRYFLVVLVLISWGFILPYLKHRVGIEIHYWYLVFTIISMSLYAYLTNQLAMYRLYSLMKRSTFLEPILAAAWFLIAYYIAHTNGLKSLFIMTIMSYLGLSMYIWLRKRKEIHEPQITQVEMDQDTKTFLKNAVLSTVEFGSGIVMIYTAVFFLMHYYSIEELGDFQVVTKPVLMYMITLFVFPVFRFLLPELSKLHAQKSYAEIVSLQRWFYKFAFLVSGTFALLMVFYSESIVSFLFKPEYHGAYLYLTHLSFFFIFIMLNAFQLSLIKASGGFAKALFVRVSGIGLFVVAFYLTRLYSESSVSVIFGLALGYTGMFVLSFVAVRKIMLGIKPVQHHS
jgi:O-antigen/teichoic acid export membrane protein